MSGTQQGDEPGEHVATPSLQEDIGDVRYFIPSGIYINDERAATRGYEGQ